jgi:aminoglycoside phosphotransferase
MVRRPSPMTPNLLHLLPKELKRLIGDSEVIENTIGCSNAVVLYLKGIKSYLKIAPYNQLEPLEYEAAVLNWLQNKLPVPKVHYYAKFDGREYLLMSEIEGLDCANDAHRKDLKGMVINLAEGLKLIHSVDISNCPFDQTLRIKLEKAKLNIDRGLVDEAEFETEYRGMTASELYALLLERQPGGEDLVFTHGDYCLPNIILKDNAVSGFIDWGRAGVADRYQDLALAARSLRHNFGSEELVALFFDAYGIKEVENNKVDFYILLDEFF